MAKFKIDWSVEAKLDLINILDFYRKRNQSSTYSIKLNAKINKSVQLLKKHPFIGKSTDYDSVRVLITGDYQIVYEIFDQLILVIMIWDCQRDPEDKVIDMRIK